MTTLRQRAAQFDPEFRAALRYFLEQRSHPSNRAVMIVCKALGVSRSRFFEAGERLHQVEKELAARGVAEPAEPDDPG